MNILAIDPGSKESAFIIFDTATEKPVLFNIVNNQSLLDNIRGGTIATMSDVLAIESIEGFGMTAGQELFDTLFWAGRFCEAYELMRKREFKRIGRKAIKVHLCGHSSAKDKDIREALIYRFGEPGNKRAPGKLFGISAHVWAALAVAVYQSDMSKKITVENKIPEPIHQ